MKKVKGGVENKMMPITLMLDPQRHQKLREASESTRISMSEIVRISIDNAMVMLKNPAKPDSNGLTSFLNFARSPKSEKEFAEVEK